MNLYRIVNSDQNYISPWTSDYAFIEDYLNDCHYSIFVETMTVLDYETKLDEIYKELDEIYK